MKKILFILIALGVVITLLYSPTGTTSKTLSLTGKAIEDLPQETQEQVNKLFRFLSTALMGIILG